MHISGNVVVVVDDKHRSAITGRYGIGRNCVGGDFGNGNCVGIAVRFHNAVVVGSFGGECNGENGAAVFTVGGRDMAVYALDNLRDV